MNASEQLSAGLKALPDKIGSFASTQAAWRFYGNEAVSLSVLQEPLTAAAHEGIARHCNRYALCVHDWSHLSYKHINKTDTYAITHETDIGYDLQTSLIVSDQTGQPPAPVAQRLVSADGSFATYGESKPGLPVKEHLDESNVSSNCSNRRGITWNHGNKNPPLPSQNACWSRAWPVSRFGRSRPTTAKRPPSCGHFWSNSAAGKCGTI